MTMGALKLTTYFGERDRLGSRLLADELFDLYERHEVRMSLLMRGVAGFGAKHQIRTDQLLTLSEDLPAVSVAIDTRESIDRLLPELLEIKRSGLVTLERARLLTPAATDPVGGASDVAELGAEAKLTVYVGRGERVGRVPAFAAVCDLLHRCGLSGASVLLGVDGTSGGQRQRASFFARNADVPMMIISVGPTAQIEAVLSELHGMLASPLMTLERVSVCKRDGELFAAPPVLPGNDEHGLPLWQKLMIHTSEAARAGGVPVHLQLLRRLREARAAGATVLRGIWGFHGDHAPHGDRLLQLHRHVPVVTVVIDRPERISELFPIIDEITGERGLVTSEIVPAVEAVVGQARSAPST